MVKVSLILTDVEVSVFVSAQNSGLFSESVVDYVVVDCYNL